jgi:hypothetical protein
MAPLFHALYTNAFGRRGQGFRTLFVAPEWPPADRRRVGGWLESLRPDEAGAEERLAVNGFRVGGTLHACLARLDDAFARDEHGRGGGRLVHALLLPLDEDLPADDFIGALLAASRAFDRPPAAGDEERLEAYLERCRAVREARVQPVDLDALRALDADFLIRFYAFSSGASRAAEAVFGPSAAPLADALVLASGGLPPRLRLACRWALGLRATPETSFVARRARDGEGLPPVPEGPGRAYAGWLRAGGAAPRDWDVRSWDALLERMR